MRIETRSPHRAQLHLNEGTPARHVLETALARTDTIVRFEQMEPPMTDIFIDVVGEERARKLQRQAEHAATPA